MFIVLKISVLDKNFLPYASIRQYNVQIHLKNRSFLGPAKAG